MNEGLIEKHNSVVKAGDVVYHLGDFGFTKDDKVLTGIVKRLKGQIHLILGNHDCIKVIQKVEGFAYVGGFYQGKGVKAGDQYIFCSHFPHLIWDHMQHGAWHCHGHCHGNLSADFNGPRCDVGVDCWNGYPVSIDQLKTYMGDKCLICLDHHGRDD